MPLPAITQTLVEGYRRTLPDDFQDVEDAVSNIVKSAQLGARLGRKSRKQDGRVAACTAKASLGAAQGGIAFPDSDLVSLLKTETIIGLVVGKVRDITERDKTSILVWSPALILQSQQRIGQVISAYRTTHQGARLTHFPLL
jgi:hypothetical protein